MKNRTYMTWKKIEFTKRIQHMGQIKARRMKAK